MQKRLAILYLAVFLLMIFLSIASALSLKDYFGMDKITGRVATSYSYKLGFRTGICSDPDYRLGINQTYVQGKVTRRYLVSFIRWKTQTAVDSCFNSSHVIEYTCVKDARISSSIIKCVYGCANGACISIPPVEISIATLKDVYAVGEKIGLTDPPENTPQTTFTIKNVNAPKGTETTRAFSDALGQARIKDIQDSKGYIVQFSEEPLTVKENQLRNLNKSKEKIKNALKAQKAAIKEERSRMKSDIAAKLSNKKKGGIVGRAIAKLTGSVVENPSLNIMNEYENVFNGLALNISGKEANEIRKISGVKGVYPNLRVNISLTDSVQLINATQVWQLQDDRGQSITGKNISIAIIDTGVDYTHPDLGGCFGTGCKVVGGFDVANSFDINYDGDLDDCFVENVAGEFCENRFWVDKNNDGDYEDCYTESAGGNICELDSDPMDDNGHGTHCASIAAGNGVLKGVAPDAKIYAYKVLSAEGWGYSDWIIGGIERAIDPNQDGDFSDRVDVISMSLGGEGNPDDPMSQAIDNAVGVGITAVIAAGNSGPGEKTLASPGTARKAITVGATDKSDVIAGFSSRGLVIWEKGSIIKPDVVAPGVNICAAQSSQDKLWQMIMNYRGIDVHCVDNNHIAISGTSMATPHVAGAAALIKQKHPDWTPEEIKMALRNNAKNLGGSITTQGYGRIDVLKATQLSTQPPFAFLETSGLIRSSQFDIIGQVKSSNFKNYSLYYSIYKDKPDNWVEITTSNILPTSNVLYLGFDISSFISGKYLLRLVVLDSSGQASEDISIIIIDKELKPNFPIQLVDFYGNPAAWAGFTPSITDVEPDGKKELVFRVGEFATILSLEGIFKYQEQRMSSLFSNGPLSSSAVGDIDSDKKPEIFFTGGDVDRHLELPEYYPEETPELNVFCFNMFLSNLSLHPGWPQKCPITEGILKSGGDRPIAVFWGSVLSDVNKDSSMETISLYRVFLNNSGNYEARAAIASFDKDGKLNWFKIINPVGQGQIYTEFTMGSCGIGDVNNDGRLEIVTPSFGSWAPYEAGFFNSNTSFLILDENGNILKTIDMEYPYGIQRNSPVLVDLDGDGDLEIGMIFNEYPGKIRFVHHNGSVLWEFWPYQNDYMQLTFDSMAVGDLNKDGKQEIVFGDIHGWTENAHVYVLKSDGSVMPGWPQNVSSSVWVAPVIGDLDGDGYMDIAVTTFNGLLYAWDRNGNLLKGFPKEMYYYSQSGVAIDDLDNDGLVEIAAVSENGKVYVWDLQGKFNKSLMAWPLSRYDSERTGCYRCEVQRPQSKIVNTVKSEIVGYLTIRIDKKTSTGWVNYREAVSNRKVIVPASGLVKLDTIFNPLNVVINEAGTYRVVASFSGKEASFEFKVI